MAISTAYLPVKLSGDGVTVAFSFGFRIYANTDLKVSWILKTTGEVSVVKALSTDYTVAINANSEGGIVTFGGSDVPPSTVWVLIESVIPKTQPTVLGVDAKLSEKSIETMTDRQCRLSQQLAEATDRSLKLPPALASAGVDMNLPGTLEGGKVIGLNADADGFQLYEADSGVAAADAEAAAVDAETAQAAAEAAQTLAETAKAGAETAQGLAEDAQTAAEAAQAAAEAAAAADPFSGRLLHVRDEVAANTAGGTFTSGAWQTRTLQTLKTNEISGASLGSNQITLPAGTYFIDASAPGYTCDNHVSKLYNVTDASDVIIGTAAQTNSAVATSARSHVRGRFTLAAQKVLELRHRCTTTKATDGFGLPTNVGVVEVYSEVLIWKVA